MRPQISTQIFGATAGRRCFRLEGNQDVDVIVAFERSAAEFRKHLATLADRIKQDGMVWIAWPKKASGVETDMTENVVRDFALPLGLVDIKVCAIDDTWSGLKLVIRKENRAARAK